MMNNNPIVKCPCIKDGFWSKKKYKHGWFQREGSKLRRYLNDDKGSYLAGSQLWSVEAYQQYFDLTPVLGETKMSGYSIKPVSAQDLRNRVIEYLHANDRSPESAHIHMQALHHREFFAPLTAGAGVGVNLQKCENILFEYLDTQCYDGKNRALKFLGYKTTEIKEVEKLLSAGEICDLVRAGKVVRFRRGGFDITKGSLGWTALHSYLPEATLIQVYVEEEVEV